MWSRLDDALMDHAKVFAAGELIGRNGPAIALGLYAVALMWANKHLTDGDLPIAVVKNFRHVDNPAAVADALVKAGLWDKNGGSGFHIHDFGHFNLSAAKVKKKRREDRARKAAAAHA
jgi:hypothetical protein